MSLLPAIVVESKAILLVIAPKTREIIVEKVEDNGAIIPEQIMVIEIMIIDQGKIIMEDIEIIKDIPRIVVRKISHGIIIIGSHRERIIIEMIITGLTVIIKIIEEIQTLEKVVGLLNEDPHPALDSSADQVRVLEL